MTDARQLELELEMAFNAALMRPVAANIPKLWLQFEQKMSGLSLLEQLRLGGIVIDQLASLCKAKADWLLEDWQETYNLEGPAFSEDLLQGLVRQTQQVDVSAFTEPSQRHARQRPSEPASEDSIAGEVDKSQVLAMVEQLSTEAEVEMNLESVAEIAHDEGVGKWVAAISGWMRQRHLSEVSLIDLQRGVQMPLVKVWLALLLGGYPLEQRGDFYEVEQIWVSAHMDEG